jgi:hypothetical protein
MNTVRQSVREFRAMTRRVSISTTIALWVCLSMTIMMFAISLFIPPRGVIDASVFKAAGFLFAFASLFELREAIREGLGVKLTHGATTIEVHDLDGAPAEDNNESNTEEDDEP